MVNFNLHPKQTFVLETEATEILYGGAAGGGKSHLLRIIAILCLIYIPNIQIYLFRRLSADLEKNHLDGENGFRNLLSPFINAGIITIVEGEIRHNSNGAKIHLCHCQHEKDRFKYQGPEIHLLLIDELTHFTDKIYRFLRNRVRMPPEVPSIVKKIFGEGFVLPKIICGSNPGNVGHTFVKQTFIDMLTPFELKQMPQEEGGMLRQYIPALLEDNPSLTLNDPGYEMRLQGLGSPDLVKAMRYGLWDITAGAALEKLRVDKHKIRDFQVPRDWTKFMVIDWGSAKPFSVGWYCVVEDDMTLKAKGEWADRLIPKGALIRYREWYGWNGKANEGCRLESPIVAKQILDIEEDVGEEMDYRVGDSAMWSEHDGASVQQRMYDGTDGRFLMEQSRKGRAGNFEEVRARIAGDEDGPMFYATAGCKHFWRTVPDLQLDERKPESGPESSQEDHCVIQDTVLFFKDGCAKIGDKVGTTGEVWTPEGWREYYNCRLTQKDAKVIDVYVGNKKILTCTPDHKLLTEKGWKEAKDCVGESLLLSTPKYRCSKERNIDQTLPIGSNESNAPIFKAMARVLLHCSIGRYGGIIKEQYQKITTFITLMGAFKITRLRTWSVLRDGCIIASMLRIGAKNALTDLQRIFVIGMSGRERSLLKSNASSVVTRLLQQNSGRLQGVNSALVYVETEVERERPIPDHQYTVRSLLTSNVIYARKLLNRIGGTVGFARKDAKDHIIVTSVRSAGIADVYCMTVPEMHCFTLKSGVVVHNCYDDVQYACASRPYITTHRDRMEVAIKEARRLARKNS